jgi:cytochrome c oxidase cbb3-type subunit 3
MQNRISSFLVALLVFSMPWRVSGGEGERLYIENCGICHGENGQGGVGVPLALPAFLVQSPDEYLTRTIRHGRPGRIMPAFNHLSDKDVNAIVTHIRGWQTTGATAPNWNDTPVRGNAVMGRGLYDKHCARCHGEAGAGGKGTGMMFSRPHDLPIMPPAIANIGFLQSTSDNMLHTIIKQGRASTPMPSAAQLGINDIQINHIIRYLRSVPIKVSALDEDEPAALIYDSTYSFDETVRKVKEAAVGMNFRLIRDQHLDSGMVPEGKETRQQLMVYFCNFKFLYDALAIDPRVGLFLPCRVTVIENSDGKVQVMSINPKRLGHLFNNNQLDQACDEMHKLYVAILEEATL